MSIAADDGGARRIYTDERATSVSAGGRGPSLVSVAGWEGDTLVVESTDDRGLRIVERYVLDEEARELRVNTSVQLPRLEEPVEATRVYVREG